MLDICVDMVCGELLPSRVPTCVTRKVNNAKAVCDLHESILSLRLSVLVHINSGLPMLSKMFLTAPFLYICAFVLINIYISLSI